MDRLLVVTDILVKPGTGLVLSPPLEEPVTLDVGDRLRLRRPGGEELETRVAALVKSHGKTRLAVPMTPSFEVGTEVRPQEDESAIISKSDRRSAVGDPLLQKRR